MTETNQNGRPRIVLATRNPHKLVELSRIFAESGLSVELLGLDAFPDVPEVVEDGLTFADNALKKAREVSTGTGLPAIADDSGLCVDVLNGMPGVFSARWAGRHRDDGANLRLVLDQISDVPDSERGAQFVCAAALVLPNGREAVVDGRVEGHLIREPRGASGFGYDPIFVPDGSSRTTAELDPKEKDAISHRGRAIRALAPVVAALLG
ncbi:MAG: RdgB/HAM1 family non-canonical purine NTP pyrophosphatase [Sporichthyaceae bacterium]|nr:RdgB/HAM1 family non-canonical purine NTP pyrophosphatase [Sporichthyaceae bacterium]